MAAKIADNVFGIGEFGVVDLCFKWIDVKLKFECAARGPNVICYFRFLEARQANSCGTFDKKTNLGSINLHFQLICNEKQA